MIEERAIQIRVGIFVTAGLLLAMLIIFMIGSERAWFERRYSLYCTFNDISGLGKGAPVSLAGMRVGSVHEVRFPEDLQARQIVVELQISEEFRNRIRADSDASIVTQGLLGDKMIAITVGSPGAEPLNDGDELTTTPSGDLYSIGKSANDLVADARKTLGAVQEIVDQAKQGEGLLHALLYDPEGKAVIADLGAGVQSVRRVMDRVEKDEGVGGTLANLQDASHDLKTIMAQIRRGEGTVGGLLTDDAIYNDLRKLFGRANRNWLLRSVVRSLLQQQDASNAVLRKKSAATQ